MKSVTVILLFSLSVFAQPQADSLLKQGLDQVYERPHHAIAMGQQVLAMPSLTPEQKTEAFLMISTAYSSQRNYFKSLDYAVRAAERIERITDDGFKINAYCRLAVQYQQLQVYNKAHEYLDKAVAIIKKSTQKFDDARLLGFNNAIRGMVYKQQMSCDIAHTYFNKALHHYRRRTKDNSDFANMSIIWYNKGNCFLSLQSIDSARASYRTALDYADAIKAKSLAAFAKKGLAEVKTAQGYYHQAIQLLLEARQLSDGIGDLVLDQGISKGLAENYLLVDQVDRYHFFKKEFEKIRETARVNNTRTLNQFVIRSNAEIRDEIKSAHSRTRWYTIGLAGLTLGLVALLVYEVRRSKRHLDELKRRRDSLRSQNTTESPA